MKKKKKKTAKLPSSSYLYPYNKVKWTHLCTPNEVSVWLMAGSRWINVCVCMFFLFLKACDRGKHCTIHLHMKTINRASHQFASCFFSSLFALLFLWVYLSFFSCSLSLPFVSQTTKRLILANYKQVILNMVSCHYVSCVCLCFCWCWCCCCIWLDSVLHFLLLCHRHHHHYSFCGIAKRFADVRKNWYSRSVYTTRYPIWSVQECPTAKWMDGWIGTSATAQYTHCDINCTYNIIEAICVSVIPNSKLKQNSVAQAKWQQPTSTNKRLNQTGRLLTTIYWLLLSLPLLYTIITSFAVHCIHLYE